MLHVLERTSLGRRRDSWLDLARLGLRSALFVRLPRNLPPLTSDGLESVARTRLHRGNYNCVILPNSQPKCKYSGNFVSLRFLITNFDHHRREVALADRPREMLRLFSK